MGLGSSILVGLVTGFISGILSGFIVTRAYRKKDEKENIKRVFYNGLYGYYEYIRNIIVELDWLHDNPDQDYKDLFILVKNYRAIFEDKDVSQFVDDDVSKLLRDIYNVLNDLENNLGNKEYNLYKAKANLFKYSIRILNITNKRNK